MMGEFTKNITITFVTKILTIILSSAIIIIIARVLGPEKQGIYSLAILLPAFLLTFNNFGISQASVYCICKKKYDPKVILGNNILFTVLISAIAISIGLTITVFFRNQLFPGVGKIYLILALFTFPPYLFSSFLNNIFLGLKKIEKFNLYLFLQPFFFLVLLVLMLFYNFSITLAIFAEIISLILTGIMLFFWVKKETNGISLKLNKSYLKEAFLFGGKVYLGNFFYFLQQRMSMFLINIFINPIAAGFYAIATGTAEKLWLFSQSAETILFPKVASENDSKSIKEFTPLLCRNFLLITALIGLAFFFASRWIIVLLFSKAYLDSVLPFQILLIGVVAVGGGRILTNDIAGRGRPDINVYLNMGIAVLSLILNVFLIPLFGIGGAAWATTISYVTLLIGGLIIYSKISGNRIVDIILVKKSDFVYYKNLMSMITKFKSLKQP